jgi:membrane protein implicated in regulation of membrane protease activity
MNAFFVSLGVWNWFIAAAILFGIEIMAPGTFTLWLGLSALLVGLISLAIDWSWQAQLVTFAVFAVASIPLWRRFFRGTQQPSDHLLLNRRNDALIGRFFKLENAIVDGFGTVRVGDTVWRVSGPDTPVGSRVKVTGTDAAVLIVAPAPE